MTVGEKSVNPLRDEASPHLRSGNQKKKTRFAGLFFLTGLRPVLLLGQCSHSKSVALHPQFLHKSALALWSRQIGTYNVTNTQQQLRTGLTGEAWPACRAIRPFHSNTT